jgi:hypothetical protein
MTVQAFEISRVEDLEDVAASVGLPVGPRTGPGKRTQEKKEWYVVLGFLRGAIPAGIFKLPITIRDGRPPDEPDFVIMRAGTKDDVIGLVEITEATDESDQKEMTAFERSGKRMAMLGHSGGRFSGGASRPGLVWASDIVEAINRKGGKIIFKDSPTPRHLIIYPNSNASILLSDDEGERDAICSLRDAMGKAATLAETTNGCLVHVLGKRHICIDIVGDMRVLHRPDFHQRR